MKSIQLPPGLANSIEQKLQAEQDAMGMEFILQQAKLESWTGIASVDNIRLITVKHKLILIFINITFIFYVENLIQLFQQITYYIN